MLGMVVSPAASLVVRWSAPLLDAPCIDCPLTQYRLNPTSSVTHSDLEELVREARDTRVWGSNHIRK